jgi:hypothetical protein
VLPRAEFIFTIGYDGPAAVIDKQAKRKYGKLSTRELAEKGLFRAAYSSAVYPGAPPEDLQFVAEAYGRLVGHSPADPAALDRLFGVFPVDVKRSISL